MKILVIDVGGKNIKVLVNGQRHTRKFPSGPGLTPQQMVDGVRKITDDWKYEAISIGFPGPVLKGMPTSEPKNLGVGWVDFDFEAAFGRPVKIINDAAMQALGSYEGGKMLFVGLGTGMGSAMINHDLIEPMELGHLPYKKNKTFEDYVGQRGKDRLGKRKWRKEVARVVNHLQAALQPEYVVLGGGNANELKELPPGTRLGNNADAFIGGFRLWQAADASRSPT